MNLASVALAFVRRDLQIASGYRLRFISQLGGAVLSVSSFYLLSRLVTPTAAPSLAPYGGDYFAFVLIGIALSDFMLVAIGTFEREIRAAQTLGTLEALLLTPLPLPKLLFCTFLYPLLTTGLRLALYLLLGWLLFAYPLTPQTLAVLLLALPLATLPFIGIGLLSAAFIIIFKQGSPLNWLIGAASALLGGVLYPVSVLPDWLRPLADWIPLTHGLTALRKVLLQGAPLQEIAGELVVLLLFSSLLLALGIAAVRFALQTARRDGTLLHY